MNLIVGRRGTGKTVFINEIESQYSNDTYRISQFESTKQEKFLENEQKNRKSNAIKAWKEEHKVQLDAINNLVNEVKLEIPNDYIEDLKNYAEDLIRSHSKDIGLFKEQGFELVNIDWVESSLRQMKELIESKQLWEYIDNGRVYKENLISLYNNVRSKYKIQYIENNEKKQVNELMSDIQNYISSSTGKRLIPSCDFSGVIRQLELVSAMNSWVSQFKETTIDTQNLLGYQIQTNIRKFTGAREVQTQLGTQITISDIFESYANEDYFSYLLGLKDKGNKEISLLDRGVFESLVKIETNLLNEDGSLASGGQSVALALTLSLDNASSKEIILVDEPEASLDNAFIKEKLILKLKELARDHTVFVITHNSTLGALLNPDYLIVAKKNSEGEHSILTGEYSSKNLTDAASGKTFNSYEDFVDAMEAGIETYNKKGDNYNDLKN